MITCDGWRRISRPDWPAWWHAIKDNPARSSRCSARSMRMMESETVQVGLWALYRQACAHLPAPPTAASQWTCRACQRGFASKARLSLSVDFFKIHGRVSRHRLCVIGTDCRACGGRYWSQARLQAHLASSKNCVDLLVAMGRTTDAPLPGRGSKHWRKIAVQQFSWQPVLHGGKAADKCPRPGCVSPR